MQAAADAQPSAMVSVIGLDADQVQLLCEVRLGAVKACMACRCEGAQAGLCEAGSCSHCTNDVIGSDAVQVQLLYERPAGLLLL